jgi:hypothetical protein
MFGQSDDIGEVRERARQDAAIEARRAIRFEALAHDFRVPGVGFGYRLPEKRALLVTAVEEIDLELGPCEGDGKAGETGAASRIQDPRAANVRHHGQTIK